MRDQEQRARIARQPPLEPQHRVEVEMIGRLVEQQQVGAAHQRLCEIEAHAPAAGEFRDRPCEVAGRETQARKQARGARRRRVAVDGLDTGMRRGDSEPVVRLLGRAQRRLDRRAARRRRPARTRAQPAAKRMSPARPMRCASCRGMSTVAGLGRKLAPQQREQARLAAAVRPDHADAPAGMELQRRVLDQSARAAGKAQVLELNHAAGVCASGGRAF